MTPKTERSMSLGAHVAEELERARQGSHDEVASRVRQKLVARETPQMRTSACAQMRVRMSRPAMLLKAVVTFAACASIAGLGYALTRRAPAPLSTPMATASSLTFNVGGARGAQGELLSAPTSEDLPIAFSDGSRVRLAPSSHARVTELAAQGARVLVEEGTVHVSVVHHDTTTRWIVAAGPYEVRVTGTRFDVTYEPTGSRLHVRLDEGSVVVTGCASSGAEGRVVRAGESIDCELPRPLAPAMATVAAPAASTAPTASTRPLPVAVSAPANVVALAKRGAYTESLMAAEANGFSSTCDALSETELLLLADAARYAGRFDRAIQALTAARLRFPGSDAAASAAFELGRIAMDVQRELVVAGDSFETYLRERPAGSLAREAMGRALEARQRSGDHSRAERLAVRYLEAYPDGPHAKLAHKVRGE